MPVFDQPLPISPELSPVLMQKLADLLTDPGLDFWGFHCVIASVQKDLPDGYCDLLDFLTDYSLAIDLLDSGQLDDYLPLDESDL